MEQQSKGEKCLYRFGGYAAILQIIAFAVLAVGLQVLGSKPTSAEEYFAIQQSSRFSIFLRGDFPLLVMIGLYLFTFSAVYLALKPVSPVFVPLAVLFTFISVTITFSTESTFSLLHLGDLYAKAATGAQQAQYLAAGEAIIASDMWNSSGAYMSGLLLQGSGVMISVIMLRSNKFSRITAISGLIGNGLDLVQHIFHPFFPPITGMLAPVMGLAYLFWYPMLARDFFRLGKKDQ